MKALLALLWLSVAAFAGAQGLSVRSPFYAAEILKPPAAGGGVSFPSSGLVHYWALGEAQGNPREDSVGSVDFAETVSTPSVAAKNGNGASLNVGRLTSSSFTEPSSGSVGFWFKLTSINEEGLACLEHDDGAGERIRFTALGTEGGEISGMRFEGSMLVLDTAGTLALSVFHLVVGTWSGSTFQLSVDGSTFISDTVGFVPGAGVMILGGQGGGGLVLDELGIWSRALTQQEVTDIWNSGAGLFGP